MHLFTFDSDKRFLLVMFATLVVVASTFYFYVETKSELLARQKKDGRYIDFVETYADVKFDIVTLGSSHAERADLAGVAKFPLSAPFSLPTVMYIKAKLIVKAHPEVKVVYIEADDHLLFNGPVYSLDGLDSEQKRKSKLFEWGGAFIDSDNEAEIIFGKVSPSSQDKLLLIKDDVKPVILKRIITNIYKTLSTTTQPVSLDNSNADCTLADYPKQANLAQETYWSTRTDSERDRQANVVIAQHKLDQANPLDNTQALYFEKTIQYLRSHNIDVVLVHYPESPEFVAKKNPEGQKQYEHFLQSLVKKYHLRTVDMRGYTKYGDRFFDDQDHVDSHFQLFIGKALMQDYCANVAKIYP